MPLVGGFKRPRDLEGKPHGVRGRHRPLQRGNRTLRARIVRRAPVSGA